MSEETTTPEKITEGWQADKPRHQLLHHYIVDGRSLCEQLGSYSGQLIVHKGRRSRENYTDCAYCFRQIEERIAKAKGIKP